MCAWKHPQEYFEDGDIIEPSDWRINQQEFLGEFNGNLDSDNLYAKTFRRAHFLSGTFNSLYQSSTGGGPGAGSPIDSAITFNHYQAGWKNKNSSGSRLPYVVINAKEDGLVIVDASITTNWLAVDLSDDTGSIHYSYFTPSGVYIKVKSAFVLCAMYRITCNGLSVCQSGPIGNEYKRYPTYLTGALPITAGQNEVRIEARFAWYSPGNDRYIEASAKKPTQYSTNENPTWADHVRQDVEVGAKMIVNHRKR